MGITKDKRGLGFIVPLITGIIVIVVLFLLIQWNPFHSFDSVKSMVNYFIFFAIFLLLQAGILYGYYRLGKYVKIAFEWYNFKIKRITHNIHSKIEQSQFR